MRDEDCTREELINKVRELRQRVSELEDSEAKLQGTERALREREARFRSLYENAPLGYQSLDEGGRLLEVNGAWLDILGYTREEAIGKRFGDFLAPSYQDHFKVNFPKFIAAGEIHGVEFEMVKKDGSRIAVSFDGKVGRDEQARFMRTHCILHDITDRRHTEEEMEKSLSLLRATLESTCDGILVVDRQGKVVTYNREFTRMWRIPEQIMESLSDDEALGFVLDQLESPDAFLQKVQELYAQPGAESFDVIEFKDGRVFERYSRPQRMEENIVGRVWSFRDVTKRKKTEQALVKAKTDWERTFHAVPDLIMILDDHNRIISANKATADRLGVPLQETIGMTCFEAVHGEKSPPEFCPHVQLMADGKEHSVEVFEKRLNGTFEVTVSPLHDEHGDLVGSVHVAHDITQRKIAEEALRESEERLALALEGAEMGLADWDLTKGKAIWSYRAFEMLGYSFGDIDADVRTWKRLVHPEDWPQVSNALNEHLDGDLPNFQAEYRIRTKSGDWKWISDRGKVVQRDTDGRPVRMLGTSHDITDRKRAEEQIREQREFLKTVVESLSHPFYVINADDYTIELANRATMLTSTEEKTACYSVLHHRECPCEGADHPCTAEQVKNGGQPAVLEHIHYDQEGTPRYMEVHAYPIFDAQGRVVKIIEYCLDITDRKLAEEALQKSEANFRAVFDSMNDAIFVHDAATGEILDVNRKMCEMYGYSVEEARLLTVGKLSSGQKPYSEPDALQWITKASQEGPQLFEWLSKDKDGRLFWVEVNLKRAMIGGQDRLLAVVRDISERERTEESLRRTEELQRTILETSPVGIGLAVDRKMHWVNDAWKKMFRSEVEGDDCVGKDARTLYPTREEFERVGKILYTGLETGQVNETDAQMIKQDGSVFDAHIRMKASDPASVSKGTLAAITDISDRKEAERALRESERRYRDLFDNAPIGIFQATLDGRLLAVNRAHARMLGYASPEDEVTSVQDIARELWAQPERRQAVVESALTQGQALNIETALQRKDGGALIANLYFQIARNDDGTVRHLEGFVEDVTDRKRIEEEKASLKEQLLQAQKMEAIGTLTGGIAHEFNNLLTIASGFTELILAEKDERDPSYEDLRKVFSACQKGADLVRKLRSFAGKADYDVRPLNLNREIERSVSLLSKTIPRMIQIEVALANDLHTIEADSGQIGQLFMNLALNARDAMPDGGRMTIETRNTTLDEETCSKHRGIKPGEYVQVTISDTGHGMDQETLSHVFEPFFTTRGLANRSGLGLSVVHGLVEQHGGFITCESEVGSGTTLRLYLPAVQGDFAEPESAAAKTGEEGVGAILLVDDEELIRDLGKRILTRAGYKVLSAASGEEALDLYRKKSDAISLVILDLIMPGMGGKQCMEALININPSIKIVIATGLATDGLTDKAIAGAMGFVNKPYNMREFLKTVRETLDLR